MNTKNRKDLNEYKAQKDFNSTKNTKYFNQYKEYRKDRNMHKEQ
jgi:hypothetical protein